MLGKREEGKGCEEIMYRNGEWTKSDDDYKGKLEEENAESKGKMILTGLEEQEEEESKEQEEGALISYIFKMRARKAQDPIYLNLRSEEDMSCLSSLL